MKGKIGMVELKAKTRKVSYFDGMNDSEKFTVKLYLTPEQVELIGDNMLKCSNEVERNVVKNTMLVKLMTDIPEEVTKDYDLLVQSGVMEKVDYNIINVNDIDNYVADELSVRANVNKFLEQLNKTLDKYAKKMPNDKQLKEMMSDSKKLIETFGKK